MNTQTIFKGNKRRIEFIHSSFKEFLLAEYIFSVFIRIAALDEAPSNKAYLCIGEISEETINFLNDIVHIAFDELKSGGGLKLLSSFFDSINNTYPEIHFKEALLKKIIKKAKKIIVDATPILLKPKNDNRSISHIFNQEIVTFPSPDFYSIVYQERWIALDILSILYPLVYQTTYPNFFQNLDNELEGELSEGVYQLLVKTPIISIWSKKLLSGINLNDKDLQNVDLNQADLSYASLDKANFTGAKLKDSKLNNSSIKGAKLVQANLSGAKASECDFTNTDLTDAVFEDADLCGSIFKSSILEGTNFKGSKLNKTEFNDSTLKCINFEDAMLFGAHFIDLDIFSTSFKEADFIDKNFFISHSDRDDFSDQEINERTLNLKNVNHDNKTLHDYYGR